MKKSITKITYYLRVKGHTKYEKNLTKITMISGIILMFYQF